MNRTTSRLGLVVALLLTLAACGGGKEVGTGVGVNDQGGASGALRDTTTTAAAVTAPTTTAKAAATTTAPKAVTTTAPPASTTTAAPQNVIKIQDDEQGAALDPRQFQVPKGSTVTWKNVSAKGATRQVAAENNAFVSPEIPPGGSWTWTANVPTQVINYRDTSRPYAVAAQLQVY
jgi:plastocyanin